MALASELSLLPAMSLRPVMVLGMQLHSSTGRGLVSIESPGGEAVFSQVAATVVVVLVNFFKVQLAVAVRLAFRPSIPLMYVSGLVSIH